MDELPLGMSVIAGLATTELLPEIPELKDVAYFDQDRGRYDETGKTKAELRVRLHEASWARVFAVLK